MSCQIVCLSVGQTGIDRTAQQPGGSRTGEVTDPVKGDDSGENKTCQHGGIVSEGLTAEKRENFSQRQLGRRDFGMGHVPAFRVIEKPDVHRVHTQLEQRFLYPADHPDEIDVVPDLSRDLISHVGDQRTGKNNGKNKKPQPNQPGRITPFFIILLHSGTFTIHYLLFTIYYLLLTTY